MSLSLGGSFSTFFFISFSWNQIQIDFDRSWVKATWGTIWRTIFFHLTNSNSWRTASCTLRTWIQFGEHKREFRNQWHWDKTSVVKPGLTIISSIKHTYPKILTNSTKYLEKAISTRYPRIKIFFRTSLNENLWYFESLDTIFLKKNPSKKFEVIPIKKTSCYRPTSIWPCVNVMPCPDIR